MTEHELAERLLAILRGEAECPRCGAKAGQPCLTWRGMTFLDGTIHPERIDKDPLILVEGRMNALQGRVAQLTNVQIKQVPQFSPEKRYLGINVTITGFIPDADGTIFLDALEDFTQRLARNEVPEEVLDEFLALDSSLPAANP